MKFLSDKQRKAVFARLHGNKTSVQLATRFYDAKPGRIGKSGRIELVNGKPVAYLYATPILTAEDHTLVARTGGYRTNTTKERLNTLLSPTGKQIVQRKGDWKVVDESGNEKEFKEGEKFALPEAHPLQTSIKKKSIDTLPIYALESPEDYNLSEKEQLQLWQKGVDSGIVWKLQGWYGRAASDLISRGLVKRPKKKTTDYYGNPIPTRKQ